MNSVSRRLFLTRGSLTVAAAGIAASVPGFSGLLSSAEADAPAGGAATSEAASSIGGAEAGSTGELTEPLVAHVKDLNTGEISIFMGEHEYTYRDPQMAAKLLQAAR